MAEISIVVPIYKEYENIKPFLQRTENILKKMEKSYEIIFALDPSTDNTEQIILEDLIESRHHGCGPWRQHPLAHSEAVAIGGSVAEPR